MLVDILFVKRTSMSSRYRGQGLSDIVKELLSSSSVQLSGDSELWTWESSRMVTLNGDFQRKIG